MTEIDCKILVASDLAAIIRLKFNSVLQPRDLLTRLGQFTRHLDRLTLHGLDFLQRNRELCGRFYTVANITRVPSKRLNFLHFRL